ncbi:hypothetical protein [Kitasatospora sp. NPDC098663]
MYQSGRRNLWDELEAAYRWWADHDRFGPTVTLEGQHVWLDSPDNPVPQH